MKKQIRWWLYQLICFALDVDGVGNVTPDHIHLLKESECLLYSDRRKNG